MDSLTQATLGALCGEITMRKQLGWKAPAWGFFWGTLPDLDIIASPFLEPLDRLGWHRGLSHSLLVMLAATIIFGYLLAKLHHKKGITPVQAGWFIFLTWSTHVTIDCFTTYGTQIYEPFSDARVAWNNMSIIDLFFTVPMLLALILVLFFKKESPARTWIGRTAAIWLCCYVAASFYIKDLAREHFEKELAAQGITASKMVTAPTLSNIFLWRMVAESEGNYHIGYWSIFDSDDRDTAFDQIPAKHEDLGTFAESAEVQKLIWFSQGWYQVIRSNNDPDSLLFIDMRFTEMHTPGKKAPVFVWKVTREGNDYQFRQVSFRENVDMKSTLGYLRERIRGDAPDWMQGSWPWETDQNLP
ncbi:membrane protein [Oceaniferula spumae]|uniref:Membrane protein n=1 Tax=Oceaniferula spumae TaxID=2979115 RepID=A0AAT9FK53_9BACT